ncbi:hypothetical protein QQP08_011193 [Theobroma cacao]|nr:hypothetical protein QQP08_011193 [Theobroma cacao]
MAEAVPSSATTSSMGVTLRPFPGVIIVVSIQHAYPDILRANPKVLATPRQDLLVSKEAFAVFNLSFALHPCESCKGENSEITFKTVAALSCESFETPMVLSSMYFVILFATSSSFTSAHLKDAEVRK